MRDITRLLRRLTPWRHRWTRRDQRLYADAYTRHHNQRWLRRRYFNGEREGER